MSLDDKLLRYLEQREEEARSGITLERVYRAALNVADGLVALERREVEREGIRQKELLSAIHRITTLEANYQRLVDRLEALEQANPSS